MARKLIRAIRHTLTELGDAAIAAVDDRQLPELASLASPLAERPDMTHFGVDSAGGPVSPTITKTSWSAPRLPLPPRPSWLASRDRAATHLGRCKLGLHTYDTGAGTVSQRTRLTVKQSGIVDALGLAEPPRYYDFTPLDDQQQ